MRFSKVSSKSVPPISTAPHTLNNISITEFNQLRAPISSPALMDDQFHELTLARLSGGCVTKKNLVVISEPLTIELPKQDHLTVHT